MPDPINERMDLALHHLTYARSFFILGAALAAHYPTPAAWEEALQDSTLLDSLRAFSTVVDDIERSVSESQNFIDPEEIMTLSEQHYDRAVDSVADLSETLEVPAEDLIVVLMQGG